MKSITNYLDLLKEKTGSDYATAKALKITKESVSLIRSRGKMSDETAVKMAEVLNIDASEILISASIARSSGEVQKAWEKIYKKIGIAASYIIVFNAIYNEITSKTWEFCILC